MLGAVYGQRGRQGVIAFKAGVFHSMYNSPGVKIWDSVEALIRKSLAKGFKKRPII